MRTLMIEPVPKPRMTQRDRWAKRPAVVRYHQFCDELRGLVNANDVPIPYRVTFYLPIPKSWSKKRKAEAEGEPHTQRPDKDNLEKAFLDALFPDDSHVWSGWAEKRWSSVPRIEYGPITPAATRRMEAGLVKVEGGDDAG